MPESRVEKNFWENNKEVIYFIIFFIVSMAIVLGILLSQGKHYSPSPWTTIETPTPTAIIETPTPTAIISKNMPVIGLRLVA